MPDTDESTYRRHYRATADDVEVREPEEVDTDDDIFEIRMPIATTGEVRNADDDPLTREELRGMARQIAERQIGVFPAHGRDDMIAFGKYSPFERLGDWREASVDTREREDGDDEAMLMATARMPNPEELPAATGEYRKALAILKEQAMRGIAQDASIGWRDDEGFPGGVDLMEASIVGIGADWRTNTGDEEAETTAGVVARAAVDAGADPDALVDAVRGAVSPDQEQDHDMTDSDTEDDPAEQDADDGETTERAPDDVSADDLLTFAAVHLDGMDEDDLAEAIDAADAEYIGSVDLEELFDFVSIVTGAEYDAVADAMSNLMDGGDGDEQGDYPKDDEEEEDDEDEEQSADDADSEQANDGEDTTEQDTDGADTERDVSEEVAELRETVESYREELDKLREGGLTSEDVETPDADEEQDASETEATDTAEDADESRDSDGLDDLGNYR